MSEGQPSEGALALTLRERVQAEQIRLIIAQTPQGVAAPAAMAVLGAAAAWNVAARAPLLATLGLLALALLSWGAFYRRFLRTERRASDTRAWVRGTLWRTALHGLAWGAFSLVVFQPDSVVYQSVDVAFMYGLVAGAVVVDGPLFAAFLAFALPTLVPVVVRCFLVGAPASLAVGAAGLVGLGHGLFAALNGARLTETKIRTDLENLDLLRDLEREKREAELARREAEAANREKSRFLAAASHDLRQPVHALSLFTAAARAATSDEERRRLLEHIADSVGSLSALFDSLLEVSRLDAGVLEPRLGVVRVDACLRQLAVELGPEARERGLALRVRVRPLAARTDAVLLERLLRNLLANALRYTERGGILLACRARGGRVRIEVWDTGIGIAAPQQTEIFEPFFQLDNQARDRRLGVGLGLAIVQRIALLLEHRLSLSSRVGRGSCFALELPRCPLPTEAPEPAADSPEDDDAVLLGAVVVVIDDEPDVRLALELLLKQYGASVVVADTAEAALSELSLRSLTPDVVLSDYRLRGEATGLDAVKALRQAFGGELRAAIVTGDTAGERLVEVTASGLAVLHKPVPPGVLRRTLLALLRP